MHLRIHFSPQWLWDLNMRHTASVKAMALLRCVSKWVGYFRVLCVSPSLLWMGMQLVSITKPIYMHSMMDCLHFYFIHVILYNRLSWLHQQIHWFDIWTKQQKAVCADSSAQWHSPRSSRTLQCHAVHDNPTGWCDPHSKQFDCSYHW